MDGNDELSQEFRVMLNKINLLKQYIFNQKKISYCEEINELTKKHTTDDEEKDYHYAALEKALEKTNELTKMVSELLSMKSIESKDKLAQVNLLKEEIKINRKEIQNLTESFKTESELKNELESLLIDSQINNAELQKKLDDTKLEHTELVKKLEKDKFDINKEFNKVMSEKFKLIQLNAELEQKNKQLEQEIKLLQTSAQKPKITKIDLINKPKNLTPTPIPFIGISKQKHTENANTDQNDSVVSNAIITNSLNFHRSQTVEKNVADSSNTNDDFTPSKNLNYSPKFKADTQTPIKKNINKEKYKPLNVLQKQASYKPETKKNIFSIFPPNRKRKLFDPKNYDIETYWDSVNNKTDN